MNGLLTMTNVYRLVRMNSRIRICPQKYKIVCPFHLERTPSCVVNEKTMTYYCLSCGKSGDVDWKLKI